MKEAQAKIVVANHCVKKCRFRHCSGKLYAVVTINVVRTTSLECEHCAFIYSRPLDFQAQKARL